MFGNTYQPCGWHECPYPDTVWDDASKPDPVWSNPDIPENCPTTPEAFGNARGPECEEIAPQPDESLCWDDLNASP